MVSVGIRFRNWLLNFVFMRVHVVSLYFYLRRNKNSKSSSLEASWKKMSGGQLKTSEKWISLQQDLPDKF